MNRIIWYNHTINLYRELQIIIEDNEIWSSLARVFLAAYSIFVSTFRWPFDFVVERLLVWCQNHPYTYTRARARALSCLLSWNPSHTQTRTHTQTHTHTLKQSRAGEAHLNSAHARIHASEPSFDRRKTHCALYIIYVYVYCHTVCYIVLTHSDFLEICRMLASTARAAMLPFARDEQAADHVLHSNLHTCVIHIRARDKPLI